MSRERGACSMALVAALVFHAMHVPAYGQQMDRPQSKAAPGVGPVVSFKNGIQPILDAQCVACHSAGAASADLNLEDDSAYTALVRHGSQQSKLQRVVPGKPEESYLLHKLQGSHVQAGGKGTPMPPLAPLSKESIATIRQWILQGARDN